MAVTKTHPIKSTLKAAIDYICNPDKTDGKLLVSSFGCTVETADIEFAWTRRHAIDKGTNLGRHLIQAFEPGEVTPEEALAARIAGRPSPSRQPKQRTGKPSLLIDIQNNIKAQQSAGYKYWTTIENLKRAAETLNFLTEHGIGSLEDLSERCDGAAAATARVKADLRATKKEMERLTLTMKHAATYRQLRPLYEEYRQSRDKEKFLRGHEGEIILFEAAARELKRLDAVPLPATKRLRAEMDGLTARRTALQSEYRNAQREKREYDTLLQNVEALLEKPREAEPQRQRNHELE